LTRDAIVQFQRENGLVADGIVDAELVSAVRRVWEARYSNQPTRAVLAVGAKGENVRAVQERLSQLGFFNRALDGNFGEYTKAAVLEFQREYRLNPTGKVDRQTWQALGFDGSVATNLTASNRYYVAAVPMQNSETLYKVQRFVPNAFPDVSMSGNYVNAGAFSDRSVAESLTKMLRSKGLNAKVQSL
jgi:peptidoglycan hydrolase-like protein with peptidoglycan-binding domain